MKTVSFLLALVQVYWGSAQEAPINSFERKVKQDVEKQGYPLEIYHDIPTEDGYLLTAFRVPHGKSNSGRKSKPVIFLMHGLLGNGRHFLIGRPEKVLSYLLADKGYDVWIGNSRGNLFSKKHKKLAVFDKAFWNFSWHEIAIYDLPAMFDFIKNVTKKERLAYVGISQGTTEFFALQAARPEYNKRVTVMIGLAPVAYMKYYKEPITRPLVLIQPLLENITNSLGIVSFPPPPLGDIIFEAIQGFCSSSSLMQEACYIVIGSFLGVYRSHVDEDVLQDAIMAAPQCSLREVNHHAQNIRTGKFRRYDFGQRQNLQRYGSRTAPSYDLSKVTSPVALFYSEGDLLAQPKDVEHLCRELGNCAYQHKVPDPEFQHLDFVLHKNVVELVYKFVLQVLDKYKE